MQKLKKHIQKLDTKQLLLISAIFVSLCYGFYFPNSGPRLAESFRDLGTSIAYYFQQLFDLNFTVRPTVIDFPEWELYPSCWELVTFLPYTWEQFVEMWESYWNVIFTKENLAAYGEFLGDVLFYVSRISVFILPAYIIGRIALGKLKTKHVTARSKKSKPLLQGEKFAFKHIYPAVANVKDFIGYAKAQDHILKALLAIWLLNFNVFSIII